MIYCNVSDCSNWQKLDESVSPKKFPGFVPLFDVFYKGTCKSNLMKIERATSLSNSGVKQLVHICANYNTSFEGGSGIVCIEDRCLYNNSSHGCTKDDIYVEMQATYEGTTRSEVPVCKSFSNRKFKGHVDWRRLAEGGYDYNSSAP